MQFSLVDNNGARSISIFAGGEVHVASDTHPNFERIVANALENTLDVSLFDAGRVAQEKFESLSANGRVTVQNGHVFFDGDEVDNALTQQIIRFLDEGVEDWQPLVNFFEKVADNPQEHSRTQLFDWLSKHQFTITPNGDLVGYKGVRKQADGSLVSISRGPAIVDGVPVNGAVPNEVGSVVEIARSAVHHDPSVGCSTGLHVGTYSYANDFAQGALLEVHVNPRDIVSVPTDCNWQKVRCCRYKVVKVIDAPYTSAILDDEDEYEDDGFVNDEQDEMCECGCDVVGCCYDDLCDDCGIEQEFGEDNAEPVVTVAPTATAWDTRLNYTKQQRYPAGHPKAGQFIPKGQ